MVTNRYATVLVLTLAAAGFARAAQEPADSNAMIALATHSGCLTCHTIKSGTGSNDTAKPIGPAWQDVAAKYKGQKGAVDTLASTVMGGSNPYQSHWKGKVTGLAMPPNQVAITRSDARRLVKWILTLDGG